MLMRTPKPSSPAYGYGMELSADGSFGHLGGFAGIGTHVFAHDDGYRLIVLSNLDGSLDAAVKLMSDLAGPPRGGPERKGK
jgi:hypothetical protein